MGTPVVGNFVPDPSIAIDTDTPIAFDVTDSSAGFREVIVVVKFSSGPWEVAYDGAGAGFGPNYSTLSTVASITNGFHFRLRRDQGWATPPNVVVEVHAIDTTGAEG